MSVKGRKAAPELSELVKCDYKIGHPERIAEVWRESQCPMVAVPGVARAMTPPTLSPSKGERVGGGDTPVRKMRVGKSAPAVCTYALSGKVHLPVGRCRPWNQTLLGPPQLRVKCCGATG